MASDENGIRSSDPVEGSGRMAHLLDELAADEEARQMRTAFKGSRSVEEADAIKCLHREIGGELYRARLRARLSQEDVASLMGTAASAISRMECGRRNSPTVTSLFKYADAVDCHLRIRLVFRDRGLDDC